MDNYKRSIFLLAILLTSIVGTTQTLEINWKLETTAKVLASPIAFEETVFVGDIAGVFFAIDQQTGNEKWRFETDGNIQAKGLIVGDNIFFESGSIYYLLKQSNGKEIWKLDLGIEPKSFTYKEKTYPYKIDPFDDKRSGAIMKDGLIYIGSSDGSVYVINAQSGKVTMTFKADDQSPIRSAPFIANGNLFFGDWNGMVYCYDLSSKVLVWKKKTYRGERPYATFGGVVSEFLLYNELLFFGARNHMMNVLLVETGEKEWTYTDAQGGWMIGDPVIDKDTLYIGGSDNFSMYAFNPNNGRPIWSHNGEKNIYTKPVLTDNWLLYTAGNGYNWRDKGSLFLLDRMSGEELAELELTNGVFSSPLMEDNLVVFGCYDGFVYGVRVKN